MFQNKTDNEEFDLFLFGEFSDKRIALRGIHKMGLCGGGWWWCWNEEGKDTEIGVNF